MNEGASGMVASILPWPKTFEFSLGTAYKDAELRTFYAGSN
jgi:hypothetical protein